MVTDPRLLEMLHNRYQYLLIDEYQDSNPVQVGSSPILGLVCMACYPWKHQTTANDCVTPGQWSNVGQDRSGMYI